MSSADGVYQVDVQTNINGIYISNTYHVIATSFPDAVAQMDDIVINQAALIPADWIIDRGRVSTPDAGDGQFFTKTYNQSGFRTGIGEMMPLFCRFRVDLTVGYVRPGRKFLLGLAEGDQANGQLTSAARAFVISNYINPMLGDPGIHLCSPSGAPVISMAPSPTVGMRQLRRASKRKDPVLA